MSLLPDTILSASSTRLHSSGKRGQDITSKRIRKSQSHASILNPLVQLVRNPVGIFGGAVGNFGVPEEQPVTAETSRKQVLYLRLKHAVSYHEWKAAAAELDALEGNDVWKEEDDSSEYDAALVAARLKQLDDARLSCDVRKMLFLIRTTLTRGLGDMGHLRLYKHSHIGTKKLIERYIDSAQQTMEALIDVSAKQGKQCPVEPRTIVERLLQARQSFGRSALLLSGGGTFGMNHIGVVKSLWDAKLLPRIISGASAGSIVCAVLCTKTDEEIPHVLHEFCYGDLNVFGPPDESMGLINKAVRMLKTGVLFDISHLMRVMRGLLGDMTFQEAYNRTRRILNIPVSTSSLYEAPRLLNYVTAPNVMIWSAVCTSCSVPLVYKKASLLAKDPKTGSEIPWDPDPNATWIDGSVDNDLPMTRLSELFNVNHFIVSQVNPHVVPFLEKEEELVSADVHGIDSSWISNAAHLAKGEVLHRLQGFADLGIFPNTTTKLRSVLSQKYSGDINIFPEISYADFPRVLSNPTQEFMMNCMLTGQRATWPKLSRIQNHVAIELALDELIHHMRTRVVFTKSQVDLRLSSYHRPSSEGNDTAYPNEKKSRSKTARFELKTEPSSPVLRKSGFTSPALSRGNWKTPPQPLFGHTTDASRNHLLAVSHAPTDLFSSSNDTSDRDYFADPDSDTTDILSSPSPPTTPTFQSPRVTTPVRLSSSQPSTPSVTTVGDRRTGTLLNLTMTSTTSAQPSSPELRYKQLFHPPGAVTPDPNDGRSGLHDADEALATPFKELPGEGRRRSIQTTTGFGFESSGTRGMLMRSLSYKKLAPDVDQMEK